MIKKPRAFVKSDSQGSWQLIYGTLMIVLMIFFLILYMYVYSGDEFELLQDTIDMRDMSLEEISEIRNFVMRSQDVGMPRRLRLVFQSPLMFELGSDLINREMYSYLKSLAAFFMEAEDIKILIEGHTCDLPLSDEGKFSSNRMLSQYRALSVLSFFLEQGISPNRMVAVGWGEFNPRVDNDSPENRARNRRIELVLTEDEEFF